MKVLEKIEDYKTNAATPISLTIGNFDGLHLGHKAILDKLREAADETVVLTFSNHPAEILSAYHPPRLVSPEHKLLLLEEAGINTVISIPFTQEFSQLTAEGFLSSLKAYIPFSFLVLGHDAVIGHRKEGTPEKLKSLSRSLQFSPVYLDKLSVEGIPVSSTLIRTLIGKGLWQQAPSLLGRPYSIAGRVQPGSGNGKKLGIQTANIDVEHLCIPPCGVYIVEAVLENQAFPALANLGRAPTLHSARKPLLEVHVLKGLQDMYGKVLETRFLQFLRPERSFTSAEDLRAQIQRDKEAANHFFRTRIYPK